MNSSFRIILIFVVGALIGFALLPLVAVELNPRPVLPVLTIQYGLPQASPEVVEAQATAPLENVFSQLRELKKITSVSRYNAGSISLHFDRHTDLNFKRFEVASLIRRTYPTLPKGLTYPQVRQGTERAKQASPILSYSINAPFTPTEIKQTIEALVQKPLTLIEGVSDIQLQGATDKQIAIAYKPELLAQYQLTPKTIGEALQKQQVQTHLGSHLTEAGKRIYYRTAQNFHSIESIANLPIATLKSEANNYQTLHLRDVAEVYWEAQRISQYFRINGKNAITLNVYAHEGVNQLELAQKIQTQVQKLLPTLPAGYGLLLEYDNTAFIQLELQKIYTRSGLSLLILVALLFVLYRRVWYVLILVSSLVVTLGLTCFCLYVLGITLHLYSLAGLTLSFGLVLDNAIMMLAHLKRYQNTKVLRALLGATLCTVVALSLIFGLPEEERMNLTDFAVVVILNLLMSLVTAIWFTPAMFRRSPSPQPQRGEEAPKAPHPPKGELQRSPLWGLGGFWRAIPPSGVRGLFGGRAFPLRGLGGFRVAFYTFLVLMFGLPVFALPTKVEGWTWYNETLGNEWYVENVRPHIDKWLGGALRVFVQEVYEKGGYREAQKTTLYAQIQMPQGTTLEHINRIAEETEATLATTEGLAKYVAQVYSEQSAFITITFTQKGEQENSPQRLKQMLVGQSIDKAGAEWSVYGVGEGFSNGGGDKIPSFKVEMRGYNYLELERQANILARKLMAHKRIQTVNTNERVDYSEKASREWVLKPHQKTNETAFITQGTVVEAIQNYTEVNYPQMQLLVGQEIYPILWQSRQASEFNLQSLWINNLPTQNGTFRVADFGKIDTVKTTNALHRENRQYIRMVAFEYFGSAKFGDEYLDKILAEMRQTMPVGYEAKKISYQFGQWDKVQRQYGLVVLLGVAIFIICAILFESLRKPFWIILNLPIAFVGLFLTFAWGGFYFDQGGYAAFFLLGGLVVNASIYIVNDYNNLPTQDALQAVAGKATPILLTLFSNIMSLVPFLSEGDSEVFWFSLAVGTIGGLVFSLLGIFVLLPMLMWQARRV